MNNFYRRFWKDMMANYCSQLEVGDAKLNECMYNIINDDLRNVYFQH